MMKSVRNSKVKTWDIIVSKNNKVVVVQNLKEIPEMDDVRKEISKS